jgi:hypothetical protein
MHWISPPEKKKKGRKKGKKKERKKEKEREKKEHIPSMALYVADKFTESMGTRLRS